MDKKVFFIFVLVAFTFLLTSCGTHVRRDGPPNFYVDERKIPNAVPKPEPLARLGNKPYYWVKGKRYYTMKSCKNYQAVGIASWYGTMFHDHRTSSGEPYDMLGMTAAHKTLPLPTYVEVTNLKNHRKIIVKVNDRGPFKSDRIIDLSYVAAKKLGMLGRGTALVKIKAIDPYSFGQRIRFASNKLFSRRSFSRGPYKSGVYLQVGAFRQRSNAHKLQQRLASILKMPVEVSKPSSSELYKVHVGPIKDMATADVIKQQLNGLGIKPLS